MKDRFAFFLGGAAPDAVHLADDERVLAAFTPYRTSSAQRFGEHLAGVFTQAALGLSGEEQVGVDVAAGSPVLPLPILQQRVR